ncbi:hypothetical protein Ciccas_007441 [Cichlidogyrus casuarinus]|uniref:ABC transporter domain-containing protein n=1 Tax=Cichlidogyrus casuarinus TaxID=1844966 RepID=A0ABD2Q2X3_9PLAT
MVAQSGGGKSTLLQLVQRFYDPINLPTNRSELEKRVSENELREGNIPPGVYFDGYNVAYLNPQFLRAQIGVVSQEPTLFDLTIRENIAYGSENCTNDQIIEAARSANIHEFVMSLPEAYDTRVGEKGSKLSGGQKQRVAIARALVRKPKLLVLDEATSALDNESERIVQAALDEAMADDSHTSLVVAHRLTTVEKADEIVVLAGGVKIENGSPDELMRAKGAFFQMHNVESI